MELFLQYLKKNKDEQNNGVMYLAYIALFYFRSNYLIINAKMIKLKKDCIGISYVI